MSVINVFFDSIPYLSIRFILCTFYHIPRISSLNWTLANLYMYLNRKFWLHLYLTDASNYCKAGAFISLFYSKCRNKKVAMVRTFKQETFGFTSRMIMHVVCFSFNVLIQVVFVVYNVLLYSGSLCEIAVTKAGDLKVTPTATWRTHPHECMP